MNNIKLSILIPSRNEMFLAKTVEDILSNIEGDTEIIIGLDGQWSNPPVVDDPRVSIVFYPESIGQRAMTNQLCRLSNAKYIMKIDAHCALDKGFDVKMMADMQDNWTMVPIMRNLHAFNWVCPDGHTRYQGPSGPCIEVGCGKETTRDVVWIAKTSPQSKSYCFDTEPHFQYFQEFNKREEGKGELTESMSLQGSCFMMTREKYWELNICDEAFGSWGSQGIEVAVKTWLSGGRVVVNQKTWYAHMFRTQGGDFGFPYSQSGKQVSKAKKMAGQLFFENKWPLQKLPLSWLVEKFWPIKGWKDEDLARIKTFDSNVVSSTPTTTKNVIPGSKGIIFYTDNKLELKIAKRVQQQLRNIGLPIVSASLKPMSNMGRNIYLPLERGILTMFKQQLAALEASDSEIIFFCEHDVIYHPSHFDYTPSDRNVFNYNINVWKVRREDGHSLWVNNCIQVSGLCGYRDELIEHYKERVALAESGHWDKNWGYEPGTPGKKIFKKQFIQETRMSAFPNIDVRHSSNLTRNRWSPDQWRDKKNCEGWTEKPIEEIEGWTGLKELLTN